VTVAAAFQGRMPMPGFFRIHDLAANSGGPAHRVRPTMTNALVCELPTSVEQRKEVMSVRRKISERVVRYGHYDNLEG